MALLISKVQNKNCEKGEFHEVAERNLEDTISLLLNFPWEQARHLANVELTCSSVTVEHPGGTFLKVGPYFSGKFSLYYLAGNKRVYFKPASTLAEAAECIRSFFREGILNNFQTMGLYSNLQRIFSQIRLYIRWADGPRNTLLRMRG